MAQKLADLLRDTIARELSQLEAFPPEEAAVKPANPAHWSPKEELGHLVDSAVNNHQRFVRAALHGEYTGPGYAQNDWVDLHAYQEMPWGHIVDLWFRFNAFLARVVAQIPDSALDTLCHVGPYPPETLGFVIQDYVVHMQHHLDHLLGRPEVTKYPQSR